MKIKAIVFDMEGTLIEIGCSTWTLAHKMFGTFAQAEKNRKLFQDGVINVFEWGVLDVSLWVRKGITRNDFERLFEKIRFIPGIEEALTTLKSWGYKLGIVTGGLNVVAERIGEKFAVDYVFSSELVFDENDRIIGLRKLFDFDTKVEALKEIAKKENIRLHEIAVVGDSYNDIPMFKKAGFSIAFCPKDRELEKVSDVVIRKKDLREVLKYFERKK